ncbi:glutaredoxin-C7-like [Canna indica]|uniref:Glutaredoxin-C7-like n=1 Tax=Canna indica TaxID=4628 RepID=A0AAQ3KIC7_9LILI|nr:glutaredoxin-C7-like [Canna indica]
MEVAATGALTIDGVEGPERRTERVIQESPVVVVSRRGCYMGYVMRRLLAAISAHPTVIMLEEGEAAPMATTLPALFVSGADIGGIEGLIALHLSGRLLTLLQEAGA